MTNKDCEEMDMDKWCLRWDQFDTNIREYFRTLRDNQKLFDVTLATDDGQHIQAHKIILSAGSNFFSDLFMKSNHSNMLVYLKGISINQLEPIIDFMYKGEAFITQEELKLFLETGKELQVKGLQGELQGLQGDGLKNHDNDQDGIQDEHVGESTNAFNLAETENHLTDSSIFDQESVKPSFNNIKPSFERGQRDCRECGNTFTSRQHLETHFMKHTGEKPFKCDNCEKAFRTIFAMKQHKITHTAEKPFSCQCGAQFTTKASLKRHEEKAHENS